ncbi:MAG: ferredoxin [Baekduia sp.]|jgi:ferredoxin|nr:ferredoxin [Conexibacter sp.]MDX6717553.1 ferredoxin [Baekduia sp.]
MKVVVDMELCDAHGTCVDACPEVFELDDDDELHVLDANPPEVLRDKVMAAARSCPKAAIRIVE